ncbi:MAG: tyrosine-type recombinase/integrase, partial [Actinobacteria bacterium]|nr:tyrosine-type recombinase/integrase [Actinomycetota bacterium]
SSHRRPRPSGPASSPCRPRWRVRPPSPDRRTPGTGSSGQGARPAWPVVSTRRSPPDAHHRRSRRSRRGCEKIASRRCPPTRVCGWSRNRHRPRSEGTFHGYPASITRANRWIRAKANRPTGQPLHPESINRLVQAAVARAGLDPIPYSAHSLRAGFVTWAHLRGASDRAIAHQTRHRSLATIGQYVRIHEAWTDNAATQLAL